MMRDFGDLNEIVQDKLDESDCVHGETKRSLTTFWPPNAPHTMALYSLLSN